jgi:predicted ATP-binding protein involved in virulence
MSDIDNAAKIIKKLQPQIDNAENGDVLASYELGLIFSEGKVVPNNPVESMRFNNLAFSFLNKSSPKLKSVEIYDYKGIENLKIPLSKANVTLFTGDNGAGKTTLLEAMAKPLSWLATNIRNEESNGLMIDEDDIRVGSDYSYASVVAFISLDRNEYTHVESKSLTGASEKKSSDRKDTKKVASLYRLANSEDANVSFPLLAFYPVERSITIKSREITKKVLELTKKHKWNKFEAYEKAFDASNDFELFIAWYKQVDDIINENVKSTTLEVEDIEDYLNTHGVEKLKEVLANKKKTNKIGNVERERIKRLQFYINQTITRFMPNIKNLTVERTPNIDIKVQKNRVSLSIFQLSQGERSLIGLVSDIARRLIMLNPALERPLEGSGIVIIDEVDLHLHPDWQQKVINNLCTTFPNIQFILSTHSPQVVTTVDSQDIRILKDGKLHRAPPGMKGAKSSRSLKGVFGVEPRPKEDENTILLNEYLDLVYADKWSTKSAQIKRKSLNQIFNGEEPELLEADLYIENKEWEQDS